VKLRESGIVTYWGDLILRPLVKDYVNGIVEKAKNIYESGLPLQDKFDKIKEIYLTFDNKKGMRRLTQGESYWDIYCSPLRNERGDNEGFILISRNITEQKHSEMEI